MATNRTYSTIEVCNFFQISKSTLFRWEKEQSMGWVKRGDDGQREFSLKNLKAIYDNILIKRYNSILKNAQNSDSEGAVERLKSLEHQKSILKIFCGDNTGIIELKELDRPISSSNIKLLLKFILSTYSPSDFAFREIIKLIHYQFGKYESEYNE